MKEIHIKNQNLKVSYGDFLKGDFKIFKGFQRWLWWTMITWMFYDVLCLGLWGILRFGSRMFQVFPGRARCRAKPSQASRNPPHLGTTGTLGHKRWQVTRFLPWDEGAILLADAFALWKKQRPGLQDNFLSNFFWRINHHRSHVRDLGKWQFTKSSVQRFQDVTLPSLSGPRDMHNWYA